MTGFFTLSGGRPARNVLTKESRNVMICGMHALDRAISIVGGVSKLAVLLGCKQSAVSNWRSRESVPPNRCVEIELATGGAVTRAELRPDLFAHGQDPAGSSEGDPDSGRIIPVEGA